MFFSRIKKYFSFPPQAYWLLGTISILYFYSCLPYPLFEQPSSVVLLDKNKQLLGAKIAKDGQWRFPHNKKVPEKFKQAIIAFEDQNFEKHWGVDITGVIRAFYLNIKHQKVVSGGSTIDMQVIRLARKGQGRTFFEKAIEIIWATRLNTKYNKDKILAFYSSNAPFGGNVVGLDAASWKYFGRDAHELSWAEQATLAVLPNSPSLIHLGKNRNLLKKKRDKLLHRLYKNQVIDSLTLETSILESLPHKPLPLPSFAPHLLEKVKAEHKNNTVFHSTIDLQKQLLVGQIVDRHYRHLRENHINNAAALVIDVNTNDIVAYVGNTACFNENDGCNVDIITSPRSTGSIIKPLLYCALLSDGKILPKTLIPDIPTYYGSYAPKNYNKDYDGAVSARKALALSLNVPAVRMLDDYGQVKFHNLLHKLGTTTIKKNANHYGLSLILGGAETSLWDLGSFYTGMARSLKNFPKYNSQYEIDAYRPLNFKYQLKARQPLLSKNGIFRAGAIWNTFEAMQEVIRPYGEGEWQRFSSAQQIAWKTGTSYGFRDAWAVGCTPNYVVAVWVGNADGEGRPNLVGVKAAAPILFDIFDVMGAGGAWFPQPYDDMHQVKICNKSGHKASSLCQEYSSEWICKAGLPTKLCPYHKLIHLDLSGKYQVHGQCASPSEMVHQPFFILPPTQAWYYQKKHPSYQVLPPYREDCLTQISSKSTSKTLELIYPKPNSKIYVPVNLDGTSSSTVFEASHNQSETTIHWHLDNVFIGSTKRIHEMAFNPKAGKHTLTLVDEYGAKIQQNFEVIKNSIQSKK
ncbi:MAG: penicillin-binding protein 1C [Cytophagales bacterium]|nr:penicillin-binding protein 1C [Cytophagales bacterium]